VRALYGRIYIALVAGSAGGGAAAVAAKVGPRHAHVAATIVSTSAMPPIPALPHANISLSLCVCLSVCVCVRDVRTEVAAGQQLGDGPHDRDPGKGAEGGQMLCRVRVVPHVCVHGGAEDHGPRHVPRTQHTRLPSPRARPTHQCRYETDTDPRAHTRRLSHRPAATLASVLASSGATTSTSAHRLSCHRAWMRACKRERGGRGLSI
jgi:hypothetical protein